LKAVGVSDEVRADIHEALRRGVRFLASQQQEDGSFGSPPGGGKPRVGTTLLVALALRHVGGMDADPLVRRAEGYLFEGPVSRIASMERDIYRAGIALMLLACDTGPAVRAERIAKSLWRGMDRRTGWWGYDTPGPGGGEEARELPFFDAFIPNLSTTQFAALGLRAASRLGVEVPDEVWARHALALCKSQLRDGTWMYVPLDSRGRPLLPVLLGSPHKKELKAGYFTGTCMGLANLLLAQGALADAGARYALLRARIHASVRKGIKAIHRDAPGVLDAAAEVRPFPKPRGGPRGGAGAPGGSPRREATAPACSWSPSPAARHGT